MAVEEEKDKKDESKGFAGLSSLVSDVDTSLPPAAKKEPTSTSGASSSPPPPASQTAEPQPRQQQTYQEPPQPSSGSSGGKWVIGIAAVIGVIWLIGQSNKPTTSSAPTYSSPAQSTAPSYSPPAEPQASTRPQESMPPVGQDLVFSTAQIRYCLAEDIRMEGVKLALNNYIDSDVDRFNAMVADYNSRCGSFRYRSGALESARRDVEPYRSQLQSEGSGRFARSSSISPRSEAVAPYPTPDAKAQPRSQASTSTDSNRQSGVPANAWVYGSEWYCNDGYRKVGDRCEKLSVPANAWVYGSEWYCNDGYWKVGDRCEKLSVPANAWVYGSEWYCNDGYRKAGDGCVSIFEK